MSLRALFFAVILSLYVSLFAAEQKVAASEPAKAAVVRSPDGTTLYITRGTLRVPAVRSGAQDDHAHITLAFVRIGKSAVPAEMANVILAGGPGQSGIELAEQIVRQGGSELMAIFPGDIIGIDQRGTGLSSPNLEIEVLYGLPLETVGSKESWLPLMEKVTRSVAAGLRAKDIHPLPYTTRESADDVDAVRQALGYPTINILGRSYGSHLALEIVRRHSDRIGRVVLIGPEGPDDTWKRPALVDTVLKRVAERASDPDLVPRMRRVLAKLDLEPVTTNIIDPQSGQTTAIAIGGFDLRWITAQAMSDPRSLATLPWAYSQMENGDFSMIAPLALRFRKRLGPESAMKHFIDLSGGGSTTRLEQIEQEAVTAVLGDAMNFPGRYLGDAWGVTSLNNATRAPLVSDVPILILVGDLDARTPLENGTALLRNLPNGKMVVVVNAAHQFNLFGTPELRKLLSSFLRGEPTLITKIELPPITFKEQEESDAGRLFFHRTTLQAER